MSEAAGKGKPARPKLAATWPIYRRLLRLELLHRHLLVGGPRPVRKAFEGGLTHRGTDIEQQAASVTITRDDWGIAHITGRTDADAVFGMIYAQAEDTVNRHAEVEILRYAA